MLYADIGLAVGAASASACGGGPMFENLLAPSTLKGQLRATFLAAHPGLQSADVVGPYAGHTYYGSDGTDQFWAVATFQIPGHPARPTVFWRHQKAWRFVRDTHGGVSPTMVPYDLIMSWGFRHWRHSPYYVPTV